MSIRPDCCTRCASRSTILGKWAELEEAVDEERDELFDLRDAEEADGDDDLFSGAVGSPGTPPPAARPPTRLAPLPGVSGQPRALAQPGALAVRDEALAKVSDDPLAGLTSAERAVVLALAGGARWRDVAAKAELSEDEVWRVYSLRKGPRRAVDGVRAQHLPLADVRLDVLERAMERGMGAAASEQAQAMALRAAQIVGQGLGIRAEAGGGRESSSVPPVSVTVNVAVAEVLRPPPPTDIPDLDVDIGAETISVRELPGGRLAAFDETPTVAETQPSRSRTASRRPSRRQK